MFDSERRPPRGGPFVSMELLTRGIQPKKLLNTRITTALGSPKEQSNHASGTHVMCQDASANQNEQRHSSRYDIGRYYFAGDFLVFIKKEKENLGH